MPNIQNLILDSKKIQQIIKRIAYQIYEQNFGEQEIVLIGISTMGSHFAKELVTQLKEISPLSILLATASLDKKANVQCKVEIDHPIQNFENKVVIIVDDVLNTGKTMMYCLQPFLSLPLKKLKVAVLVDRSHKLFPIAAEYVGYSLSTTVNQHIQVIFEGKEAGVYLNEAE